MDDKYKLIRWTEWIDYKKSKPNHIVFVENTPKEVIDFYNMQQKEKLEKREKNYR